MLSQEVFFCLTWSDLVRIWRKGQGSLERRRI